MQPLQICIGPTIRIGRESWCLPYAGFFLKETGIFLTFEIYELGRVNWMYYWVPTLKVSQSPNAPLPAGCRTAPTTLYSSIAVLGVIANITLLGAFFRNEVWQDNPGRFGQFGYTGR